jgi:FG-GAP-like repeat
MLATLTRALGFPALLAVSAAACSDPRAAAAADAPAGDGLGQAGEALSLAPNIDAWSIVQTADFNGDGFQDALWNNADRSQMAVWLLRGTDLLEQGPKIPGPSGSGWATISTGDFDLDGMADVPWYQATSNRFAIWLMRGTCLSLAGPEISGPSGGGWAAVTEGDFDGDGMADILWYNAASHRMSVELMRGTCPSRMGPELPSPAGEDWTAVTTADFNLDGMTDILWYNGTTQRIAVWLMRGTEILEPGPEIPSPPGAGWAAITAADFNLDGFADVLWNDTATNRFSVWLMRGTCLLEPGPILPGPRGDGWVAASAGDTSGDGMADVVWQNTTTHRMAIWTMRGTDILTPGAEIPGL